MFTKIKEMWHNHFFKYEILSNQYSEALNKKYRKDVY